MRKKRAADIVAEVKASTSDIFKSDQPKGTIELPSVGPGVGKIIEKVFDMPDPDGVYDMLEDALKERAHALTPHVLREQLEGNPRLQREAYRLYVVARTAFESFEIKYDATMSQMRDEARLQLEADKRAGIFGKQITLKDIEDKVATMYSGEYGDLRERHLKARKTYEYLSNLVDVFKARGFALKALVGGKEEL